MNNSSPAIQPAARAWWVHSADDPKDGVVWLNEPSAEALEWLSGYAGRRFVVAPMAPVPQPVQALADMGVGGTA
jgi:hypothetical protein